MSSSKFPISSSKSISCLQNRPGETRSQKGKSEHSFRFPLVLLLVSVPAVLLPSIVLTQSSRAKWHRDNHFFMIIFFLTTVSGMRRLKPLFRFSPLCASSRARKHFPEPVL